MVTNTCMGMLQLCAALMSAYMHRPIPVATRIIAAARVEAGSCGSSEAVVMREFRVSGGYVSRDIGDDHADSPSPGWMVFASEQQLPSDAEIPSPIPVVMGNRR
jgi:hypothetical protein